MNYYKLNYVKTRKNLFGVIFLSFSFFSCYEIKKSRISNTSSYLHNARSNYTLAFSVYDKLKKILLKRKNLIVKDTLGVQSKKFTEVKELCELYNMYIFVEIVDKEKQQGGDRKKKEGYITLLKYIDSFRLALEGNFNIYPNIDEKLENQINKISRFSFFEGDGFHFKLDRSLFKELKFYIKEMSRIKEEIFLIESIFLKDGEESEVKIFKHAKRARKQMVELLNYLFSRHGTIKIHLKKSSDIRAYILEFLKESRQIEEKLFIYDNQFFNMYFIETSKYPKIFNLREAIRKLESKLSEIRINFPKLFRELLKERTIREKRYL